MTIEELWDQAVERMEVESQKAKARAILRAIEEGRLAA